MRRLVVGIALLTLAAGAASATAGAASFVGQYRGVDLTFSVRGADGATYNIEITATQGVAGTQKEQSLYLHLERCLHSRCQQLPGMAKSLPDGAVTVSPAMTSATVASVLGTISLKIQATSSYVDPSGPTVSNPGVNLLSLSGPGVRVVADMPGAGTISIGNNLRCHVVADMFTYQAADTVNDGIAAPGARAPVLPVGMTHGRGHPTCAS